MNLKFHALAQAYDQHNKLDTKQLYEALGWPDLVAKPEWANTCAIRMSLALIGCHVAIPGRIAIKNGPHKGKLIEPGQIQLAKTLENKLFGKPKKFDNQSFFKAGFKELWHKTGIVSFMKIPSYAGGHIDLLDARKDWLCKRHCYFEANEVWFWEVR